MLPSRVRSAAELARADGRTGRRTTRKRRASARRRFHKPAPISSQHEQAQTVQPYGDRAPSPGLPLEKGTPCPKGRLRPAALGQVVSSRAPHHRNDDVVADAAWQQGFIGGGPAEPGPMRASRRAPDRGG